jgi:toxin ParE1/3/4
MKVIFDDEALSDLEHIYDWIAKDNLRAAESIIERIFAKVERLANPELTEMGRPGSDPGTRELIEYP